VHVRVAYWYASRPCSSDGVKKETVRTVGRSVCEMFASKVHVSLLLGVALLSPLWLVTVSMTTLAAQNMHIYNGPFWKKQKSTPHHINSFFVYVVYVYVCVCVCVCVHRDDLRRNKSTNSEKRATPAKVMTGWFTDVVIYYARFSVRLNVTRLKTKPPPPPRIGSCLVFGYTDENIRTARTVSDSRNVRTPTRTETRETT